MIIHQFNQTRPQLFEANRTQVNVNIVEATKTTMDGEIQGYEYDTVVIESAYMYTDEALEKAAKLVVAKALLDSTQFKFGDDYDQKDTPEWLALKAKRAEARALIRGA